MDFKSHWWGLTKQWASNVPVQKVGGQIEFDHTQWVLSSKNGNVISTIKSKSNSIVQQLSINKIWWYYVVYTVTNYHKQKRHIQDMAWTNEHQDNIYVYIYILSFGSVWKSGLLGKNHDDEPVDLGVPWRFQNFQTHPYFTATQTNRKGSIYRYLSGIFLFYVF